MNFLEPAVLLDQQQMDVLERVANNAGITGEELVRETLKRVLDSLEQAARRQATCFGSFEAVIRVL